MSRVIRHRGLCATLVVAFSFGSVFSQTFSQRLMAPITYEIGIQPGFQSNPLNLSELEVEKAAADEDYLGGISYSSSNALSYYGKINYSPRLFGGRKTRINVQAYHHTFSDIPERNYATLSIGFKQALGSYRFVDAGYWVLPLYYLRNYQYLDPNTSIRERRNTSFGTDKFWLGFQHRLNRKNKIDYRISVRQELYTLPFAHYDMGMQELMTKLTSSQFKAVNLIFEIQYGVAQNANQIDEIDRAYHYLNIRPSLSYKLSGKHRLRLAARYDQRVYGSEEISDPLHAGRYQEEFRLDASFIPKLQGPIVIEPFVGYRERRIDASSETVRDLKSFSRYWFGIRVGFKSVIDMYF